MKRLKKLLTVTAPGNEAVKSIAKLSSSKKARDEARAFVAEGRKLVEEALAGGCELLELFVLKDALGAYEALFPSVSGTVYAVTQPIMNKITESKTPQDITAVFAYKSSGLPKDGRRYLCLERVQEPGNVGALIRSASAFGRRPARLRARNARSGLQSLRRRAERGRRFARKRRLRG